MKRGKEEAARRAYRQDYLLSYFVECHVKGVKDSGQPRGVSSLHAPPCSTIIGKDPGGIGMANVRGLQKRGLIHEPVNGLFYLTDTGRIAAEQMLKRYAARRSK